MKKSQLESSFKIDMKIQDKINLMLDIETVSTNPDACVISIAGVFWKNFDPTPLSTCYLNLDVDEQLHFLGRKADWDTIQWWTKQGEAQAFQKEINSHTNVYQPILKDPQELYNSNERLLPKIAMEQLLIWIEQNCINAGVDVEKQLIIWSKSPSFDLVILQSLMHQLRLGKLGSFWNWRDVRTFVNFDDSMKDQMRREIDNSSFTPHLPIDDCMIQINEVCQIHKQFRETERLAYDD